MKRFTMLLAAAAFTLLVPNVADAQAPYVYRPELRAWVFVPKPAPGVYHFVSCFLFTLTHAVSPALQFSSAIWLK